MTTAEITHAYRIVSGQGLADLWWKTGRIAIKTSGAETGGRFSQVEIDDPLGTAPPMHIHHAEDETFYVVEGSVIVFAGDEALLAKQAATIDALSGGRLTLGVELGDGPEDYAGAIGPITQMPGKRLAMYVDALRAQWNGRVVAGNPADVRVVSFEEAVAA